MLSQNPSLDLLFAAMADPTRRQILDRLTHGPATVKQLAAPFSMSLPAIVQHVSVLESSGLITSQKVGRVRTCQIEPAAMRSAERWINERRSLWERRFDRLGTYLAELPEDSKERSS